MYRVSFRTVIIGLLVAGAGYVGYTARDYYKNHNDGFSIGRITSSFSTNNPAWEIPATNAQIERANAILKQPFYYLSHGFQCYAFISQDGGYVLKFPRQQRLGPPRLFTYLPDISFIKRKREAKTLKRQKRADELFQSLKIAFLEIPHETGVIFAHVNKTRNQHPKISITDKTGATYEITLDDREFVLQRKAKHVKSTFYKLMRVKNVAKAKERIDQIFQLLTACAKKGVLDMDGALISKNNIGFLEDRAIYIDAGRLAHTNSIKTKEKFTRDLKRLRTLHKWFMQQYPGLANYFEVAKNKAIENFSNE